MAFFSTGLNCGLNISPIVQKVNGKKIVVTGGASFIGSHLVESLVELGAHVVVIDDLSSGSLSNLSAVIDSISFFNVDLLQMQINSEAFKDITGVFHLAAVHGGRGFIETYPYECSKNVSLDSKALDIAILNSASWFVFASSACVYPVTEQTPDLRQLLSEDLIQFQDKGVLQPDGFYGWAKLYGEIMLNAAVKQSSITGVAARIFTSYGERENESHAAVALLLKALLKFDPYEIWGSGEQTRNFTYVGDTVAGLLSALLFDEGMNYLNVGISSHISINSFCDEIFRQLRWKPSKINYQLEKPVGVSSRASDNTRIQKLANWQPNIDINFGISKLISYWNMRLENYSIETFQRRLFSRD